MNMAAIAGLILITGVMIRELLYFTPHMIYTSKSITECVAFGIGICVLIFLTVMFASMWYHIIFAIVGMIAFAAMWLKQGVSDKGVLTIARAKELYAWNEIDTVLISDTNVSWFRANGTLIMKQKYSAKKIPDLRKRIKIAGIKEKQNNG